MDKKGRLIMVRHGQTMANITKVWHGHTNTPLTDLGREQAARLGQHFHQIMTPDVIYASDLERAHHTAQAIAKQHDLEVTTDPRLRELHLGDWEDLSFKELHSPMDVMHRIIGEPDFLPPNGESQQLVRNRMVEAIEEITSNHPGENIVVVSHGVALGVTLGHYLHDDTTRWSDYGMQNTATTEFCPHERTLAAFNRTDHLEEDMVSGQKNRFSKKLN